MIRTLIMVAVPYYREGLRELLVKSGQVDVVGAVSDAEAAERVAREALPEVLLLDVDAEPSFRLIRAMSLLAPPPRVVVLAIHETPEVVMRWAEQGVTAYVSREATLEVLLHAIEGAARGELYCHPRIAACIMKRVATLASAAPQYPQSMASLSVREREVVRLVARGLSNKKVAVQLNLEVCTVKNHVHRALSKLQVHRRTELAEIVYGKGSSPLNPA
jgi:two-component system, NarL family, nitrate/nitrite response regulator NarL